MARHALRLLILDEAFAVCRLAPDDEVPGWARGEPFSSVTRSPDELSVVTPQRTVPAGIACEGEWRALRVEGPLDFSMVGVVADLATPLADAGIAIFVISTYDTDYLFVRERDLHQAADALAAVGHRVTWGH